MLLLKNIEIRYFRSIYRVRLPNLRSLNVLSGRNDVGKSNVLKALNLFFNGTTDWQSPLDFYRDFSLRRLTQVRKDTVKGKQFISVELEFNRPQNYGGSLPESFRVKRTWQRDGSRTETNNLEALSRADKLPSSLETAKRFASIFLNRVHFEYVPAVKDRSYFEHLLSRLQGVLMTTRLDDESEISKVATNLAQHIQARIASLKDDFQRATNVVSAVEPPTEFADLFQAFPVSTESGDDRVSLSLRGDGIQARYVSSVLHYISTNSTDFFIWGFEEPENSLEYGGVCDLAEDLVSVYGGEAQIFVTSHSPALTSVRSPDNTCFRIFRATGESHVAPIWPESDIGRHRQHLNLELGILRLHEHLHREYEAQVKELEATKERIKELQAELEDSGLPILFTEGKWDRLLIETAWRKRRGPEPPTFKIRAADNSGNGASGGSGGAGPLKQLIDSWHPEDGRVALALFDRDKEGIRAFNALSQNFSHVGDHEDVKRHSSGLAFAALLPVPPGREPYSEHENLSLEFFFRDEVLAQATAEGRALEIREPELQRVVISDRSVNPDQLRLTAPWAAALSELDGLRRIVGGKKSFAEGVAPNLPPDEFAHFDSLLELAEQILVRP